MLQICYKYKNYYVENNNNKVFTAAFTTANVKLRLYEVLDLLEENVVYYHHLHMYIYGKSIVKTGCWADKLGKVVWIVDLILTGRKSYCYKTNTGKVKRFTLYPKL